jgi:hypothetical protein
MAVKCSVVFIRESAEQLTGSGCCGKLEGDNARVRGRPVFEQAARFKEETGRLHRAVRDFFSQDDVQVVQVDPRNQLYLAGKLCRDVWRYRPGFRAGLRTILQAFSLPAVVVNGTVLSRGGALPDPDALCHHIRDLLGAVDAIRHVP